MLSQTTEPLVKKLAIHALIALSLLLLGIGALVAMDSFGSTLPDRLIRRISSELPAQKPDSYFVPTPLPVNLQPAANQPIMIEPAAIQSEADQSTAEQPSVGSLGIDQATGSDLETSDQPAPSEFAIIAATVSPSSAPADASTVPSAADDQQAALEQPSLELPAVENGQTQSANEQQVVAQPSSAQPSADQQLAISDSSPQLQLLPTGTPVRVEPMPAASTLALTGFSHEWQTWNNCGPATLAMNLSFFGSGLTQADIGSVLRQHEDDKNVKPEELAAYAHSRGFYAQQRVNGSSALLKTLLSNQIPVLIETWMEPDPNDGMGHYRLLTGYDDAAQHWIAFDSYVSHDFVRDGENYEGIVLPYAETDALWRVFNRTYLLIYDESRKEVVQAIFGEQLDPQAMWSQALTDARDEVAREPDDPFVWFNLGSTLNTVGNYVEAAAAFDQARRLGLPWRMLWYQFGPFQAYYETGRYDEVMALAYATIANTESIEEIYYWKGKGLAATGNPQSAQDAWRQALWLNPSYQEAIDALAAFE